MMNRALELYSSSSKIRRPQEWLDISRSALSERTFIKEKLEGFNPRNNLISRAKQALSRLFPLRRSITPLALPSPSPLPSSPSISACYFESLTTPAIDLSQRFSYSFDLKCTREAKFGQCAVYAFVTVPTRAPRLGSQFTPSPAMRIRCSKWPVIGTQSWTTVFEMPYQLLWVLQSQQAPFVQNITCRRLAMLAVLLMQDQITRHHRTVGYGSMSLEPCGFAV